MCGVVKSVFWHGAGKIAEGEERMKYELRIKNYEGESTKRLKEESRKSEGKRKN
jgi:hypothetical protein